ncbi:sca1 complex scaffold protein scaa [Anaeramoeba flamelloides]|uniref:Sca1 complex scaffold protein scaa n=1 Tax=Anaeramoeba flamelloides TaxID=1746091 RepID=A0AAV7ZTY7_9EUKA|nr:sca1 complex scaffold protein scaa [Anaeramoeba flamelloides]
MYRNFENENDLRYSIPKFTKLSTQELSIESLKQRLESITFDQKGNLYDKFYSQLKTSKKEDKNYIEELKTIPPFPHISDYQNYHEFEQASIKWNNDILQLNQNLKLPQSIGTSLYRPFNLDQQKQELKNVEKFLDSNLTIDKISTSSKKNISSYRKNISMFKSNSFIEKEAKSKNQKKRNRTLWV